MNDSHNEVRLVLSGRITFQQDISVAQGARVISFLHSTPEFEHPPTSPEPLALPPPDALESKEDSIRAPSAGDSDPQQLIESPRQALELSGAKTIPEKMTAFGAFLLQEESRETFTHHDVRRLFQRSRERIPTHFAREFDSAVRADWILEGETKGEFYLSEAARNVIGDGFATLRAKQGRPDNPASSSRKGTRRRRTVLVPEKFSELEHIPTTLDGLIPYHQVKLKRDKLLWTLSLAKHLGIDGLQNTEATWLTDKLGDGIPNRDINGHFTGLRRLGFANRSMTDNAMRITAKGEEYLESL